MAQSTAHNQIDSQTRTGAVALTVRDLDRSLAFYTHNLGLQIHHQAGQVAHLGAGGEDLVILHANPDARPYRRGV